MDDSKFRIMITFLMLDGPDRRQLRKIKKALLWVVGFIAYMSLSFYCFS